MFNAFEDLFAPGRKHTRDEQNRLELTREDVGDADPGHGPIDLTSGKAVIRLPDPNPDPDPNPELASDPNPELAPDPNPDPDPDPAPDAVPVPVPEADADPAERETAP
ncbi:DUF6191 domain-containing protein [Streptomyces sp. NPDC051132]|uniref:DUF6191 domain-containing protein n=1 Tax=unclassified Streptomyces TaxID=2593676 RepID=UPI0034453A50